ncbi:hypothetical protein FHY16_002589 [Xanthomonas campestris]|uniref:hypothetical protein n=1 Tax=Xanthomonas euroxanthea TaxID=2259622 RepID=UPI001617DDDB|nr:hypothetical protein [Xanthomonas euroxanthea]MBB3779819.1 hypothetical protein [Xanthomonas euroxanthea]
MLKPNFKQTLLLLLSTVPFIAVAAPPRLLLIERPSPPGGSADPQVEAHLRKSGYDVTIAEPGDQKIDVCRYDLILLSSTVRSNQVTTERKLISQLRNMGIPLVTWENDLLDDLRFTDLRRDWDFGELETGHYAWMVRAPHPLSAGIPAGLTTWTSARQPAGWGRPGLGADIIMTWPGEPEKSMLFAYERGATMDHEFVAPARRVFIGMDNNTFANLTDNGIKLFHAAISWALQDKRAGAACLQSAHSALD